MQRTTGIFTLVLDGGESILTVATRVPQSQVSYFYNYALGGGYVERRIVFNDVGTSLKVHATTLAEGQIRLRLTPRISYFSSSGREPSISPKLQRKSLCPTANWFHSAGQPAACMK